MRSETEANSAVLKYSGLVRRICFIHLKSHADVEDIFQEVFLKYVLSENKFQSDAHEKAWLVRVAINCCKDLKKSFFRRRVISFDDSQFEPFYFEKDEKGLMESILRLSPNYRDVLYLFYYEGYSAVEISKILKKNENTIYTWLKRAREQLRKELGGEFDE